MKNEEYITVSVLNGYIRNVFLSEELLHNVRVFGEVSGYKVSGAHSYFTLKDELTQLSCCCFNCKKTYLPKNGESVILTGSIDYYAKGGKISFNVTKIEAVGKGLLYVKLEALKKRLMEEGYFALEHKKSIPLLPRKIGVITSRTGAVIKDIISTVRARNKLIDITVIDARVQGADAANELLHALTVADASGFDTIIIARGGGSFEDLMPFNEEKLVYAIYNAKTPVISAVGHETDFTLCDFAADLRVPTPTAAAERVAFDVNAAVIKIERDMRKAELALKQRISSEKEKAERFMELAGSRIKRKVENEKHRFIADIKSLRQAVMTNYYDNTVKLEQFISSLDKLNPTKVLSKGYFKIIRKKSEVNSVCELNMGDEITLKGNGGSAACYVMNVDKAEEV